MILLYQLQQEVVTKSETNTEIVRGKRHVVASKKLSDSIVLCSVGHREVTTDAHTDLKRQLFEIVDRVDSELDKRFTSNETLLRACDTIDSSSSSFLDFDLMHMLASQHKEFGIDVVKTEKSGDGNVN